MVGLKAFATIQAGACIQSSGSVVGVHTPSDSDQ